MAGKKQEQQPGIIGWLDYRLPVFSMLKHSTTEYPTPKNLSYFWNFGSLAGICLTIQILTGLFLAMHYTADVTRAFDSVERIMRDVNFGWLLRYTHAVGASMFFIVVYIHMFRGLYYGSYKSPREVLWWIGVVILLLMMGSAFMGYVLPWGQMSFWGATVITNLFSAFPVIGDYIVTLLWGGYSVDNPTLTRFFVLHYLFPLIIFAMVFLHLIALHQHGSNNPLGIEVKTKADTIPFHPYYTIKDFYGFGLFFLFFAYMIFFAPNYLGHADNYIEANPLVTPAHIVPEWYFLPFYAILRAVPDLIIIDAKLAGVVAMGFAIIVLFFLPWLDTSKVRSAKFRPLYRIFFWLFFFNTFILGVMGSESADGSYSILVFDQWLAQIIFGEYHFQLLGEAPNIWIGRFATAYYFGFFLVIMPLLGKFEKTPILPDSISTAVLKK